MDAPAIGGPPWFPTGGSRRLRERVLVALDSFKGALDTASATPAQLRGAGFTAAHALTDFEPGPGRCIQRLERLGERIAATVLTPC